MKPPKTATARRQIRRWIEAPPGVGFVEFWDRRSKRPELAAGRFVAHLYAWGPSRPAEGLRALDRLTPADWRALASIDVARLRKMRGNVLMTLGHYREAEKEAEAAWKVFEALGERIETARTGITWVTALARRGRFERAREVAQASRRLLPKTEGALRARLRANLAEALIQAGRHAEATQQYRAAMRFFQAKGRSVDLAQAQYGVASSLLYLGRVEAARTLLESAKRIVTAAGLAHPKALVEMQLLRADFMTGGWDRVDERAAAVSKSLRDLASVRAVAFLQMEQAVLLAAVGAVEAAEPLAAAALRSYRQIGQPSRTAQAAFVHGRILSALQRRIDARVRFRQARELWRSAKNSWSVRRCEMELAALHLARGEADVALSMLRSAARPLLRRDPHGSGVRCRSLLARAHLQLGRPGLAARLARRAHRDARAYPERLERPWIAQTAAEALLAVNDGKGAVRWARRAVDEMEAVYLSLGSRAMRGQMAGTRQQLYRSAVDVVLKVGGSGAERTALDFVARSRSPQLVEDLMQESSGVQSSLRAAIARLRDEIVDSTDAGPRDVRFAHLRAQIDELNETLLRHRPTPSAVVRRALDERTFDRWSRRLHGRILVVFDRHVDGWSAYVVDRRRRVERVRLAGVDEALADWWLPLRMLFETAAHLPAARREAFLAATLEEGEAALSALRRVVWDPLGIDAERVFVVPDGPLHGVPLEALPETAGRSEAVAVSRWPHPSIIRTDTSSPRSRAFLLHDGSKATRAEVSRIGKILDAVGITSTATGSRATFARSSRRYGLLHVAAHGTYHRHQWILNGIQLSDGWLGLEQLRRRQLRDALLYFGSCDSGLSSDWPGAEFGGWTTAGLGAGAREMVLALWKIDDEAATGFAREFYSRWADGLDAAQAAQQARRAVRLHSPHPFRWAPFLTVG